MFVYDGTFAPSVADLTAATLSEKNLLNVLTSIAELMGDRPYLSGREWSNKEVEQRSNGGESDEVVGEDERRVAAVCRNLTVQRDVLV
jgi:hypothetical protein